MSVNEIIMLSSDEENDTASQIVPKSNSSSIKVKDVAELKIVKSNSYPIKGFDCLLNLDDILAEKNKYETTPYPGYKVFDKPKLNTSLIEVVDLGVDDNNSTDFPESNDSSKTSQINNSTNNEEKIDSKPQDKIVTEFPTKVQKSDNVEDSQKENILKNEEKPLPTITKTNSDIFNESREIAKVVHWQKVSQQQKQIYQQKQNFVDLCGSLEDDEKDKEKLMKKLRKRFEKADTRYINSEEFKNLIELNKRKVTKKNLYLIAKEISSELIYNKKLVKLKINLEEEESKIQSNCEKVEKVDMIRINKSERRLINRIKRKLNEIGMEIKKLEEREVDLSDEEDSAYIKLQKYRKRFTTIYEKLCKLTNQSCDNQRICFTESKYPAINKCIEKWLNETKKFPDFIDILKLLETQSSSLGLPSDKDSLREIAKEIFQNVGLMLKRRRCCDLWDSFSGFLENSLDPSIESPELNQKLKKNFEIGIKKEQEIIDYFAEKQKTEQLQPEEVLDEEADKSPVESGSEKEDEEEEEEDDKEEEEEEVKTLTNKTTNKETKVELKKEGESKNNFKNCKSLKWRCPNGFQKKVDAEGGNSNTLVDVEKSNVDNNNCVGGDQIKRNWEVVDLIESRKRVCLTPIITKVESLQRKENCEKKEKKIEVVDVFSCQIKPNYEAFYSLDLFDEFFQTKKDFKKKKVFRDLTNVKNLMREERKRKDPILFTRSIFHSSPSWKIRRNWEINKFSNFKVQKCGSNHDEKSGKSVRRNSKDSKTKEYSNNSDSREEESTYFSGSGNEENNNGDENKKKSENIDNDEEENQNEEDEEEENESEENLHSKNNIRPNITTTIKVKPLEDIKDSLAQVKNDINIENETKSIENEEDTQKEIKKEDFNEIEINEHNKEETSENVNNGEVEIDEKICSDNVQEEESKCCDVKIKSVEVVKKTKKEKVMKKIKTKNVVKKEIKVENVKSNAEEFSVKEEDEEAIFIEQLNPIVEIKTPSTPRRSSSESSFSLKYPQSQSYVQSQKLYEVETIVQRMRQQNSNQSPSDEERVKRFLLNSPSSISITPPRKLQCKNPLSQEALQALETLKNLKGISATRVVREKPESEDDVIVIGESSTKSLKKRPNPRYQVPSKQRRFDQNPTDVQTTKPSQSRLPTPQINQNDYFLNNFHNQPNEQKSNDSSSIKISNVWGALSLKVYESISNSNNNLVAAFGGSSRQRRPKTSINNNLKKKKPSNQPVEYVVLD